MRYGDVLDEKTEERIKYELSTIEWMGFSGLLPDRGTISAPRAKWVVSVGPGCGSAAVRWCTV